jgi:hypothetical protein
MKLRESTTCVQTVGEDDNYWICGRPAKWVDDLGRPLCGIHRRQVNSVLKHKGVECQPLPNKPARRGVT